MSAAAVILHRCRFCGKFRPLSDFVGGPTVGECLHCLEWHRDALNALAGNPPKGCADCERPFAQLLERDSDERGDYRMYLHRKDGVLALLCGACSDRYERKRLDQFGDTPYGQRLRNETN